MVFSQKLHEAFKGAVERITGPRTVSAFKEKGVLTIDEFVQAGDNLVAKCPTWSCCPSAWRSGFLAALYLRLGLYGLCCVCKCKGSAGLKKLTVGCRLSFRRVYNYLGCAFVGYEFYHVAEFIAKRFWALSEPALSSRVLLRFGGVSFVALCSREAVEAFEVDFEVVEDGVKCIGKLRSRLHGFVGMVGMMVWTSVHLGKGLRVCLKHLRSGFETFEMSHQTRARFFLFRVGMDPILEVGSLYGSVTINSYGGTDCKFTVGNGAQIVDEFQDCGGQGAEKQIECACQPMKHHFGTVDNNGLERDTHKTSAWIDCELLESLYAVYRFLETLVDVFHVVFVKNSFSEAFLDMVFVKFEKNSWLVEYVKVFVGAMGREAINEGCRAFGDLITSPVDPDLVCNIVLSSMKCRGSLSHQGWVASPFFWDKDWLLRHCSKRRGVEGLQELTGDIRWRYTVAETSRPGDVGEQTD
eukprot:Gb_27672 [translate_table: standard]